MRRRRRLREAAYRDQTLLPPGKRSKASHGSSAQLSSTDGSSPYSTGREPGKPSTYKELACHGKGDVAVTLTAPVSGQVTQDSASTDWSERNSEQTVTGVLGGLHLLETCFDGAVIMHCSRCMSWLRGSHDAASGPERLHMPRVSRRSGRASGHRGLRLQACMPAGDCACCAPAATLLALTTRQLTCPSVPSCGAVAACSIAAASFPSCAGSVQCRDTHLPAALQGQLYH